MKISLENIGMVKDTSVEINGITVIAGNNNTGKSTIGKALFAVFNSAYSIENQIKNERKRSLKWIIDRSLTSQYNERLSLEIKEKIIDDLVKQRNDYTDNINKIEELLISNIQIEDRKALIEITKHIKEMLLVSDEKIVNTIFLRRLQTEFDGQIVNLFAKSPGTIKLSIKDKDLVIKLYNDDINVTMPNNYSLNTEAVYMDDPFVLDDKNRIFVPRTSDHRTHLRRKIYLNKENGMINEIFANDKLEKIYEKINDVCSGNIIFDEYGPSYSEKTNNKKLSVKNLSTGLKSFVILKTLLLNGTIESNGTIILDEPEVHLHPKWQLLFAEIIVLIQKEFGLHVLLNTHSPYFLEAIDTYTRKYEVKDRCKYYLSSIVDENYSYLEDVTDNIEKIYNELSAPLLILDKERNKLDD